MVGPQDARTSRGSRLAGLSNSGSLAFQATNLRSSSTGPLWQPGHVATGAMESSEAETVLVVSCCGKNRL